MLAALAASRKDTNTSARKRRDRVKRQSGTASKGKTWRMTLNKSVDSSSGSEDEMYVC